MTTSGRPRVLVLLAAHNGMKYIDDQVASILEQRDVEVGILVSVDRGDDGTEEHVSALAAREPRVSHLPHGEHFGAAAPNFFRLLADADFATYTHVALADQDDVWLPTKLSRAVRCLDAEGADAYSSNVWTWDGADRRRLLDKAQPQKRWDHLFSSAGPGCTYVFSAGLMVEFAHWLNENRAKVASVEYHDWLLYAWVREAGRMWWIDPSPTMLYRQHASNQMGANVGLGAAARRVRSIRDNWYGDQILAVAQCLGAADVPPVSLLGRAGLIGRLRLALMTPRLRRAKRDAAALTVLMLLGKSRKEVRR